MSSTSTCGPLDRLRDDRARRARGERGVDELVAVVDRARHGDEQVAGLDLAAVEGDAGDFEGRARRPAGRGGDLVAGPQRAHAAHSRATERVVERKHAVADDLARSRGPCPRPARCRRRGAMRIASAIASRRPPTSLAPGAPAMIAARIAAGSSLRGLSSVTITTSDRRAATAPISGPLALVAVAAGAEHSDQPAASTCGLSAAIAASSASGVWA